MSTTSPPSSFALPKLKLKLNQPSSSVSLLKQSVKNKIKLSPAATMMMRMYDSDEDQEQLPIEEHCLLQLPEGDERLVEAFRDHVRSRKEWTREEAELLWKDGRRGVFTFQGKRLLAELVDLPCIIESQKTLDHKHVVKVADICQMIRLSHPPTAGGTTSADGVIHSNDGGSHRGGKEGKEKEEEKEEAIKHFLERESVEANYIENSGLTPPMHYARLRRFRKRVNKRTVESIEREVQRLLREDAQALEVQTLLVDPSELEERGTGAGGVGGAGNGLGEDEVLLDGLEGEEGLEEDDPMDEGKAAPHLTGFEDELNKAFAEMSENSDDDEEEDDDDEEEDEDEEEEEEAEDPTRAGSRLDRAVEDDDDEDREGGVEDDEEDFDEDFDGELRALLDQQKAVRDELRDLQDKIQEKTSQRAKAVNAIIKRRFDDILQRLTSEMQVKQRQLDAVELQIQQAREQQQDDGSVMPVDEDGQEEGDHQPLGEDGERRRLSQAVVKEGDALHLRMQDPSALSALKKASKTAVGGGQNEDDDEEEEDEDDEEDEDVFDFEDRHRGLFGDLKESDAEEGEEEVSMD